MNSVLFISDLRKNSDIWKQLFASPQIWHQESMSASVKMHCGVDNLSQCLLRAVLAGAMPLKMQKCCDRSNGREEPSV
jgi:hypothetical protein